MITQRLPRHSVLVLLAVQCFLIAACSPANGPATNFYLRANDKIDAELIARIRQLSPIAAPKKPVLQAQHASFEMRRAFTLAQRAYPGHLADYWRAQKSRCQELTRIFEQAQSQLGLLNPSGADPQAVACTSLILKALDQRLRLFLETSRLADLEMARLERAANNDGFGEIIAGATEGFLSGASGVGAAVGAMHGLGEAISRDKAGTDAIRAQVDLMNSVETQLQRDLLDIRDAVSRLEIHVQSAYPTEDWSFLRHSQ